MKRSSVQTPTSSTTSFDFWISYGVCMGTRQGKQGKHLLALALSRSKAHLMSEHLHDEVLMLQCGSGVMESGGTMVVKK
jgi:hypothetical protein